MIKNYTKIVGSCEILGSNIHAVKVKKTIDTHFCFSLLGLLTLSMSKRIMNEVMCLAEDIGATIYYQDTDSMHILKKDLSRLEEAFEEKYKRQLKGNDLGQFHSDFPANKKGSPALHANESYFLAKKIYLDKLIYEDGSEDYMFRSKGLTSESVLAKSAEYKGVLDLFKKLFEGEEIEFNLLDGKDLFEFKDNMTVGCFKKFTRRIKV
jgi:hypothetical protein